jgi:hypothetical protein
MVTTCSLLSLLALLPRSSLPRRFTKWNEHNLRWQPQFAAATLIPGRDDNSRKSTLPDSSSFAMRSGELKSAQRECVHLLLLEKSGDRISTGYVIVEACVRTTRLGAPS